MPLYNSDYLKNISKNRSLYLKESRFSETKRLSSFDIFLSHSYLDKEVVEGLYFELTDMGFSVYVDWIVDPHLDRSNVTKDSAELLRKRMRASKTLLLAVSTNAATSKWMPWELGYMDGFTNSRCAILPVAPSNESTSTYKGYEYLSLYPFIKKQTLISNKLWVLEDINKYIDFSSWHLKNLNPVYQSTFIY